MGKTTGLPSHQRDSIYRGHPVSLWSEDSAVADGCKVLGHHMWYNGVVQGAEKYNTVEWHTHTIIDYHDTTASCEFGLILNNDLVLKDIQDRSGKKK